MSTAEWIVTGNRRNPGAVRRAIGFVRERWAAYGTALLLAANVFTVLASYYVLKTVREALILSEAGAAVKSYSSAGQAVMLLGLIPAYGYVASRLKRSRLIDRKSVV